MSSGSQGMTHCDRHQGRRDTIVTVGWVAYPLALLITVLVEVPIVLAGLGVLGWAVFGSSRWWARVLLAVAVNLITHPVLWWSLRRAYEHGADLAWLAVGELTVWVVETVLIMLGCRRSGLRDLGWALALAGCANAASLAVGLILEAVLGS